MSAADLEAALAQAGAALDAGDGPGAAEAVARGVRACEALSARGEPLDPAALDRARAIQAALLERAMQERDRLAGALDGAARSRRAAAAYGPPTGAGGARQDRPT